MSLIKTLVGLSRARHQNLANAVIVCDGNSLVFGQGAVSQSFPVQLQALPPFNANGGVITNFGVGGQTTTQMIADAATQVDPMINPSVFSGVIAWEWLNAVGTEAKTVEQHCADIMTYRDGRIAAGFNRVAVLTNIAVQHTADTSAGDTNAEFHAKLDAITAWLMSGAEIPLRDVIPVHLRPELQNELDTTYYQTDQVHLTAAGYGVIAEEVWNWLVNLKP